MKAGNNHWHLNKSVPVAIIFAILMQTAGALWWASKVEFSNTANAEKILELEERAKGDRDLYDRLIRVEILLENVLKEIRNKGN